MSATETPQALDQLYPALEQLAAACDRNDIDRIRKILIEQNTDYRPNSEVVDLFWKEGTALDPAQSDKSATDGRRLTLVRG
jgi:hypothetical protein